MLDNGCRAAFFEQDDTAETSGKRIDKLLIFPGCLFIKMNDLGDILVDTLDTSSLRVFEVAYAAAADHHRPPVRVMPRILHFRVLPGHHLAHCIRHKVV